MTDESRPLSRRERRAQEMRDAARTEDTTPIEAGLDTSGMPLTEGTILSRRERRRLERLAHPVETWTAEEEMLATGQIPTMTPERIAEQEQIERERAEAAQHEADTTAHAEISDDAADAVAEASVATPDEAVEPDDIAEPARASLIPGAVPDDEVESLAEPEAEAEPEPEPEPSAEAEPVVEPEPEPEAEAEAEPDADDVAVDSEPEEPVASPAAPLGMPPGMSPEMFEALFPPGSLQRRLMEQQAEEAAADASSQSSAPEPGTEGSSESPVESEALAEAEPEEPEEPEEAVAAPTPESDLNDDRGAPARVEPKPDTVAVPWVPTSATESSSPIAPSWPSRASQATAPTDGAVEESAVSEHTTASSASAASAPSPARPAWTVVSQAEPEQGSASASAEETDAPESAEPSFEAILGTGAIPVAPTDTARSTSAPSTASAAFAPVSAEASASTVLPASVPSVWDSHPLATSAIPQVKDQVDIDPDALESEPLPQPDLSGVRPLMSTQTGEFPPVEPVPTGQIEVERRERPDLGPAGGARHFGWAQVAVLGAVAFVLGVVVWNVAELG